MTRPSSHQPTNPAWLVAGLLLAAVTAAVALTTCGDSGLPPASSESSKTTGKLEPTGVPAGVAVELQREAPLAIEDANRGKPDSRQLAVHVDGYLHSNEVPLRVELLFGERDGLRTVNLFVDREGNASWPSGSEAPRPRFADFAFPTVSATGQNLVAEAQDVRLTMPPTCVLEIEVVEVDGRLTSDPLTAHVRSPSAAWPQNRWRPLRIKNGRKLLLAEAAGERVELRVTTASGRTAHATFFAASTPGERVACSMPLAPTNGIEVALQGMPAELTVGNWRVDMHSLTHAPILAHRWPGAEHRYVLFPSPAVREATKSWLVFARNEASQDEMYWGRKESDAGVVMRRGVRVAVGRVVDQTGKGAPGFHIDLVARKSRIVLVSVIAGQGGGFELLGPDPDQVALDVVLREARDGKPAAVPLPADGKLVLQVQR